MKLFFQVHFDWRPTPGLKVMVWRVRHSRKRGIYGGQMPFKPIMTYRKNLRKWWSMLIPIISHLWNLCFTHKNEIKIILARCQVSPPLPLSASVICPLMSPPTPDSNVWWSDDTCHVAPLSRPPTLSSLEHHHRYLTSWTLSTFSPPPPDWCMMS